MRKFFLIMGVLAASTFFSNVAEARLSDSLTISRASQAGSPLSHKALRHAFKSLIKQAQQQAANAPASPAKTYIAQVLDMQESSFNYAKDFFSERKAIKAIKKIVRQDFRRANRFQRQDFAAKNNGLHKKDVINQFLSWLHGGVYPVYF
ncbi:MAG: hypothetical protein U0903_17595 [Planctomycetales bacterium]